MTSRKAIATRPAERTGTTIATDIHHKATVKKYSSYVNIYPYIQTWH